MNITTPILDDSSYQDLRDRMVKRISVYNPEWTDHNASDPGITLLELFAYLGEHLAYRFNQIPETTYVEYLNLLQIPRLPAEPARVLVAFSKDTLGGVGANAGTQVAAGEVSFETQTALTVWPVTALGVIRATAPLPPTDSEEYSLVELAMDALDADQDASPLGYESRFIPRAEGEEPLDMDTAVDSLVWVAVLNNSDQPNADVLDELRDNQAVLNLGFAPDEAPPEIEDIDPCPGPGATAISGAMQWEVSTEQVVDAESPRYRPMKLVGDGTAGLRREGIVRLELPAEAGRFEIIDEDREGAGDLPPRLDEELEPRVLFWIRGFRHDDSRFGRARFLDINVSDCLQVASANPEYLGAGSGQPDQRLYLNHKPVIAESLVLEVEEDGTWRAWAEVDGFHTTGDDDAHYLLDRAAGMVQFGIKRVPQIGQRIRARSYLFGGGRSGNVSAESIDTVSGVPGVTVLNPLPAYGGSDDEPLDQSLRRIPGELRRRDRAVTPGDFQELALLTPGADIARASTLELFRPRTRETNAAGVVSVVIWSSGEGTSDQPPVPTRSQLRQVCRWLDARRLLTTEVYVIPPVYRSIAVAVGLKIKGGYSVDAVRVWVEAVLRQYLSPLPPFGPEGDGWPLGRPVIPPELEAAVLQVEGVEYLDGLRVAHFDEPSGSWVEGRVDLELDEVPWLLEITVVEGPPLDPGDAVGAPAVDGPVIPVPVIVDEC